MRIGLVAPPWAPVPPHLYGGIELVVDRLAQGLAAAGHDVVLFATGDSTCPVPKRWLLEESEGVRIGFSVPEVRHVLAAYESLRDVDLIHDHSVLGPIISDHYTDLPVVTTIHGELVGELRDIYERVATKVSVIAVSHAQRRPAPQLRIARVIHHGIDASDFPIGQGEGGYLLFLGRLSPDKGAGRAIDVARKADVPLLLAGKMREPWERDYFEARVAPFLSEQIQYLGEVGHERKLELLAGARALVFPIRWNEPFGLVMLEAEACGTPVLAFPEGAAPEVVDHGRTGFLCQDEAEMAEMVPKLGELDRAACRAAVEGYFSTERMVNEHVELYEELLS
ncbi:MAG: glycosyltransferase family 4 protein [Actinobacteria bacterium]|nr:MAG: glycosyltransferase family 4 protein [Actinomycetota bacterium]